MKRFYYEKQLSHPKLDSGSQDVTGNKPLTLTPLGCSRLTDIHLVSTMAKPFSHQASPSARNPLSRRGRGNKVAFTSAEVFHPAERSKRIAFTLAEVLITLGIIGVVATLTIPTLIQNYRKQVISTQLKKFYSTVTQAIKLSEIDNGPISNWDFSFNYRSDNYSEIMQTDKDKAFYFFDKYLFKYMPPVNKELNKTGVVYPKFILKDGSTVKFHYGACINIYYDTNGSAKGPNRSGIDDFSFILCPRQENSKNYFGNSNISFGPWCSFHRDCDTREKALQMCKNNGGYCAALLMMDSWQFKEDYPYKPR